MAEASVGEELNTDAAALDQVSGRMVPSLTLIGKATEGIHTAGWQGRVLTSLWATKQTNHKSWRNTRVIGAGQNLGGGKDIFNLKNLPHMILMHFPLHRISKESPYPCPSQLPVPRMARIEPSWCGVWGPSPPSSKYLDIQRREDSWRKPSFC